MVRSAEQELTPLQLIHDTIGNFNIQPDKTAISRIHESLSTLHQARELRVKEAESALTSTLSRIHISRTADSL